MSNLNNEPAFTEGEWNLDQNGRLTGGNGRFICHLDGMDRQHRAECRANAALIKAAPELFRNLQALLLSMEGSDINYDQMVLITEANALVSSIIEMPESARPYKQPKV
jgi:hypothetical protein